MTGEIYHIYNRGVEKRDIFSDSEDLGRFFQSMSEFNVIEPIGSLYENSFRKKLLRNETPKSSKSEIGPLVEFICYCLNPNHYHFLLKQLVDGGISQFMKRLGGGHTLYFNSKYDRSGVLFQGVFKSVSVDSNEQLLQLSSYINLNDKVHQLGNETPKSDLVLSSWVEYITERGEGDFCKKDIILDQFGSVAEYEKFAEEAIKTSIERKKSEKELEKLLID